MSTFGHRCGWHQIRISNLPTSTFAHRIGLFGGHDLQHMPPHNGLRASHVKLEDVLDQDGGNGQGVRPGRGAAVAGAVAPGHDEEES